MSGSGRVLAALVCSVSVLAAPELRADAARDRLQSERATADARYETRLRECAGRFVAAPCLEAARADHRDALARLRAGELQLDDAARQRAAAARRATLDARAAAERPTRGAGDAPATAMPAASRNAPSASKRLFPAPASLPHAKGLTGAARIAEERGNTARFEVRTREAEAHRAQVLQRNAERAASGRQAASLPAPDAAITPGR